MIFLDQGDKSSPWDWEEPSWGNEIQRKKNLSDHFSQTGSFSRDKIGIQLLVLYDYRGKDNTQRGTGQKEGENNSHDADPYHPFFRFFLF